MARSWPGVRTNPAALVADGSTVLPASVRATPRSASSTCASRASASAAMDSVSGASRATLAATACTCDTRTSVRRNALVTGSHVTTSGTDACTQPFARHTSSVHGSPSSPHSAPSGSGFPARQPAASASEASGVQAALEHSPGGTQRLSMGTCRQLPAMHASSVQEKPSSGHRSPSTSAVFTHVPASHASVVQGF